MGDNDKVLNLYDGSYPSMEYPANIIKRADARVAAFIAREFMAADARYDGTHDGELTIRTKVFMELIDRGIIR